MENKEEKVLKLLSYDVQIEKRNDSSEMLNYDLDEDIFWIKKNQTKKKDNFYSFISSNNNWINYYHYCLGD